jgi:hypothetical protein
LIEHTHLNNINREQRVIEEEEKQVETGGTYWSVNEALKDFRQTKLKFFYLQQEVDRLNLLVNAVVKPSVNAACQTEALERN